MPLCLSGRRAGLLREASDLRLLFLATLASSIGTWFVLAALVMDVYDRTESAIWVSALLLVVVFCIIPFAIDLLQIGVLALVPEMTASFFRPAAYAGLPNLVPEEGLARANGLLQSVENATLAVGPLLGGLLVAWVGPDPAYLVNAGSLAVSALLIFRIRASLAERKAVNEGHWRAVVAGLALLQRCRALLAVLVVWSVVMLGSAGVSAASMRGRAFTLAMSVSCTALGLGMVLAGPLTDAIGARAVWSIAAGLLGLAVPLALVLTCGVGAARTAAPEPAPSGQRA